MYFPGDPRLELVRDAWDGLIYIDDGKPSEGARILERAIERARRHAQDLRVIAEIDRCAYLRHALRAAAIGAAGAPGANLDDDCAKAGLAKIADRLK